MRLGAFIAGLSLVAASPTPGQDWAKERVEKSPRHGEWVTVKHGDRSVQAFIVFPEVKEKATAVVVIHEIFGLSDWVRSATDQLAEAGYIAIAPDLLTGLAEGGGGTKEIAKGGGDPRKEIGKLKPDQITKDLDACVDYLTKLPACNGKVAVTGFCWGGGQTMRFATNNKSIKAAFPFYGSTALTPESVAKIACPVYGFYGEKDNRINSTIDDTKKLMKDAGKTYEPVLYDGAGHGFMRAGEDPKGNEANKKGREDAWKRMKELLAKL